MVSNESWGMDVAKLCGFPPAMVTAAKSMAKTIFQ